MRVGAREWLRVGKDEGALFRGARLAEAGDWSHAHPLPDPEAEFLRASLDRERRDRRARRRALTIVFGTLSVALVVIAVVAAIAIDERRDAEQQRNIALSRQLALQSANTLEADPSLALTLALRAVDDSPTGEAVTALRQATLAVRELAVFPADSLTARTVAYSPDGALVAAGGDDGIAHVWDAVTRRELATWRPGHGALLAARYAPGEHQLALGFEDGTLAVVDKSLDRARTALRGTDAVQSIAYSGNGEFIAAGLSDGTVRVLAADGSGSEVVLSGHDGPVLGVGINGDGTRVVSAGEDGSVKLWSVAEGAEERILRSGGKAQTDVEFSPDGSRIMSVGFDRMVRFWNASTGDEMLELRGGDRELEAAAFSADGSRFAAAGHDGVVRVWSMAGGPPVAELRGQRSRVYDVGFGSAPDRIVSAGDDGTARVWDAGRTQAWQAPAGTFNVEFSPDGRFMAGASQDGTARIWRATSGRVERTLPGPEGYTTARYSPTADEVVVANNSGSSVRVWPSAGKAEVIDSVPKSRLVNVARFDRSGEQVVYADGKGRIVVHDLASGEETTLSGGPADIYDAQLSPDGARVAAGGEDGDVLIWRVDRPDAPEHVATGHRGHLNAVAYGPDGRIATGGADRTIRVWSSSGRPLTVLQGHDDEITTIVFTTDGKRILSSSNDGTLRLWDADGGDALAVLQAGPRELYDVTLSRDGQIATLDEDDVVRVFRCEVCGSLKALEALARTRVTRPLTKQERQRFPAAAG